MEEVVKWGPFLIKWNMVSIIVSGLFGYLLVKFDLNRKMEYQKDRIVDTIGNSIIMSFAIWKLSLIIFNPVTLLNNPLLAHIARLAFPLLNQLLFIFC